MLETYLTDHHIHLPDLDLIRGAIDAADERAKLLRRLLRLATRMRLLETRLSIPVATQNAPSRLSEVSHVA